MILGTVFDLYNMLNKRENINSPTYIYNINQMTHYGLMKTVDVCTVQY